MNKPIAFLAGLNKSYPLLVRVFIWILLPLLIVVGGILGYLLSEMGPTSGEVRLKGVMSTVHIYQDQNAIPHIKASSDKDAVFSIGYLHARDRLWQMEFQRRLGQGRLSELFGPKALNIDKYMRTLGLYRATQASLNTIDDASLEILESYVAGVNSWLEQSHTLPIEYYFLDFKPEPWTLEDSLLQLKLMALNLGFNYNEELSTELLINQVGPVRANVLLQGELNQNGVASNTATEVFDSLLALNDRLKNEFSLGHKGAGSNGWVVSGKLTQNGVPLLANDPHLGLEVPSIWYLAEIQGDKLHVTGATYPGIPFVILGHNQSVAWGGTAMSADVQDLYHERINPTNENQYEVDGQWIDIESETEWISVKAEFPNVLMEPIPKLKWTVRRTRHGPLISDVIDRGGSALALRWVALDAVDNTFRSFYKLNYAQNMTEFQQALDDYHAPALNFLYADVEGNIALFGGGKVPQREQGNGRLPVPGWQSDYEWNNYIPFDEMPKQVNPSSGIIANANNINHSQDYPHFISSSWAPEYRVERIRQMILEQVESGQPITVSDLAKMQGDNRSLQAVSLLDFFKSLSPESSQQRHALNMLKQWDGVMSLDSEVVALYQSWLRHFNRLMVEDELRGEVLKPERLRLLQQFIAKLNPLFIEQELAKEKANQVIENEGKENLMGGNYSWCDIAGTEEKEDCETIALMALSKAITEVDEVTGFNSWGSIHQAYYRHRGFADTQFLDRMFNLQIPSSGDEFTVNVGGWEFSEENRYQQVIGATYRQVISVGLWQQSGFISNSGQSGNLQSNHYDDFIDHYQKLELLPMSLSGSSLDDAAIDGTIFAASEADDVLLLTLLPLNMPLN